ncbi:B3 domain-containing transcription factor LEC2 [Rhodamnia argentea]|uniref:B3 domain-containing transcription factor LEC2 n=1 Tax=Rhodamnia argentea TaxID=178133 RepID=A0A8B8Q8U9_9MYRT|nr:B3 domain-containing transcription factor LEC2 [Rhodamnia argentea]
MHRFLAPFDSTKSTSIDNVSRQPIMGHPRNLHFPSFEQPPTQIIHAPTQIPPSFQGLPFPYPYPYPSQYSPQPFCFWQNHNIPQPARFESPPSRPIAFDLAGHQQKVLDARATKAARNRRKMARQRSLGLHRRGPSASSTTNASSPSNGLISSKYLMDGQTLENNGREDQHTFFMPNGKRFRMILQKELKNSDVGSLGRIVLPKREAEENLPIISDKEGIELVVRDVCSQHEWILRYRYWANNRSRMYLFENAGELVRENGLDIGDSLTFYEDECKNIYFSIEKVARAEANPWKKQHQAIEDLDVNTSMAPISNEPPRAVEGEEEAATVTLEQSTGQFKHGEGDTEVLAANLSTDSSAPYRNYSNVASEGTPRQPDASTGDDQQIDFDDYYRGLETLTAMDPHIYSLLDLSWIGNSGATSK